ncbi:lamin-B2-like isoform X1 [Lethenteron reissneri]|uniref:lamin-B2-like isoform X1 n=1 Tax=Lethenteron reissneri TaxID=7753 RepID=UPI002AB79358|nr:lamin-B2-like isoform X1 [Lethenteron reissneri]
MHRCERDAAVGGTASPKSHKRRCNSEQRSAHNIARSRECVAEWRRGFEFLLCIRRAREVGVRVSGVRTQSPPLSPSPGREHLLVTKLHKHQQSGVPRTVAVSSARLAKGPAISFTFSDGCPSTAGLTSMDEVGSAVRETQSARNAETSRHDTLEQQRAGHTRCKVLAQRAHAARASEERLNRVEAERDALSARLREAELQTEALSCSLLQQEEERRFQSAMVEEERRGNRAREQQLEMRVQALRDLLLVQAVEVEVARESLTLSPLRALVPEFGLSVPTCATSASVSYSRFRLAREHPCGPPLRASVSTGAPRAGRPCDAASTPGWPSNRAATRRPLTMSALAEAPAAPWGSLLRRDGDTTRGKGGGMESGASAPAHSNSKFPWSWLQVVEVGPSGRFVQVLNSSARHSEELGGCLLQQLHTAGGGSCQPRGTPIAIYRFPHELRLPPGVAITVWAGASGVSACPPTDLLWAEWPRFKTGSHIATALCRPNGQLITWHCAQRRPASCVEGTSPRVLRGPSTQEAPAAQILGVDGIGSEKQRDEPRSMEAARRRTGFEGRRDPGRSISSGACPSHRGHRKFFFFSTAPTSC